MDLPNALAGGIPGSIGSPRRTDLSERLDPTIDILAMTEVGATAELREKLDKAGRVSQSMEAALEAARHQKMEFAEERVRQLREQFGVLRWFAAADPKTAARQASRMAKALRSAVQDYEGAARADLANRQILDERLQNNATDQEGTREHRKFASEAYMVRGLVQGLADFARGTVGGGDVRENGRLDKVNQDLRKADEALRRLLEGKSGASVSVLV